MISPQNNLEYKTYKLIFVTCTYKRPEVTRKIISIWEELQEKTKTHFEYENIVIDSEKTNFDVFNGNQNFEYYEYKNIPISDKWNFAISKLKNKNFDYVIFLGSDDFIDEELLLLYYDKMKVGYDYIGIYDMYIFNAINQNMYYWGGYKKESGRQGETIGLGRCFSKNLIERLNYLPWVNGLNRGLDGSMQSKLKKLENFTKSFINIKRDGGFACDIKTDFNITKIKDYSMDFELINKDSLIYKKNLKKFLNITKPKLSIIIPTYNNIQYLDETLNTIINSGKNYNIEILVGIDNCEDTINHIKNKPYPDFIKFYYFNINNGPYDIKNTLAEISNSDNLLFFDSDDIMTETTITDVLTNLISFDVIRLKYQLYLNGKTLNEKQSFGEGVFAIKKQIFLSMNGFEPWRVAADSDFMGRLYKRKLKIHHTNNISFLYRQHSESLTKRSDTGMASKLRGNYAKISKTKKGDGNPSILHTRPYEVVTTETFTITKEYDYQREIRNQKLDTIFNKTIRKTIEVPQHKKPDPVILDRLDFLYNNKTEEPRIIKTNKPNNRQELIDKKNGTTKSTIKEIFSIKPNHRDGKNFINLISKFNK